jgi:hypothetical protein
MSGEAIADVVADIKAGRWQAPNGERPDRVESLRWVNEHGRMDDAVVVDASTLYRTIQPSDRVVDLYGDHQSIAPPWPAAFIGFENRFGNVLVSHMVADDAGDRGWSPMWETENHVDWDRVRWCIGLMVFVGGRSNSTGRAIPVTGPVYVEQYAVYPDGSPADIHWMQVFDGWDKSASEMHMRINLGVLNFLNCVNVGIAEPQRPRAERRRIERTGVRVSEIHVFPVGPSASGGGRPLDGGGTALHSVRGHFANYGPRFGRGLLFGKHEGRFFRPQHARGAADNGEVEQSYVLHAEAESEAS